MSIWVLYAALAIWFALPGIRWVILPGLRRLVQWHARRRFLRERRRQRAGRRGMVEWPLFDDQIDPRELIR